jgi:hypothetical protein
MLIPVKLIQRDIIMTRSLVIAKPIEPPKGLELFFDNPALVEGEQREDYDKLMSAVARAVNPANAIVWLLLKQFVDILWDIQRDRRIKAEIIKLKQREAKYPLDMIRFKADLDRLKMEKENPSVFKKKKPDPEPEVEEYDTIHLLAKAFIDGADDIDAIDRRIASSEARLNRVLREIDRYDESLAGKLARASSDIVDGEFTETGE